MAHSTWGYTEENGPSTWHKVPGVQIGKCQSPIDIIQANASYDQYLKTLKFSYPSFNGMLQNNGHTVVFSPENADNTSAVTDGPVCDVYKLAQFHFHWGVNDDVGSEHTVDGKPYAGELHLVHYNTGLYPNVGEALTAQKGLTVLGIFLKVGDKEHVGLKNITDKIPELKSCGSSVPLDIDPLTLFPDSADYWSYPGSLTTPPLAESVTWVVFKQPITVSSSQVETFRNIQSKDGPCLCENFRPTCELNGRIVKASFQYKL